MGRLGSKASAIALMLFVGMVGTSDRWVSAAHAQAAPSAPAPAPPQAAPSAPAPAPTAPPPTESPAPPAAAPTAPGEPAPAPTPDPAAAPAPPADPSAPGADPASGPPPVPPPTYPAPAPAAAPAAPQYQKLGKQEPEIKEGDWDPWAHVHQRRHDGFFLRLAIGIGGGGLSGNDHALPGGDVSVRGGGLATDIQIGGALVENLILHADIFQTTLFNPTVLQDGEELGSGDEVGDAAGVGQDVRMTGLGIGITYYFMPINLYLSGSVGLGQAVFEGDHGDTEGSDLGFGANLMIGKEWWVGSDWGIGAALQLVMVGADDEVLGGVGGGALNILFSATYN